MMNAMMHDVLEDESIKKGSIALQSSACRAFLSMFSSDLTGYTLVHQHARTHPSQLLYILQYLCCPSENAFENKSSIFGQTGIFCQAVRVIDLSAASLWSLILPCLLQSLNRSDARDKPPLQHKICSLSA